MKKNPRRVLGRNLARELSEDELCQVSAGLEAEGTRWYLVHHTSCAVSHDDCHVDASGPDEVTAETGTVAD